MSHFNSRCIERGITKTDLSLLHRGITWAIRKKRDDLVELALMTDTAAYWRFRCPDGIFYAVTPPDGSLPMTVLNQDMFRKKKWSQKMIRRGKGNRTRLRKR